MTIQSDTMLRDINPDQLPEGKGKTVALPGALPARTASYENLLSPDQEIMVARFAKTQFVDSTTWAQAVTQLRVRFGVPTADRDFAICNGIVEVGRHESATKHIDASGKQGKFYADILGCLTGTKDHWWKPMQDAVNADRLGMRRQLTQAAMRVETNEDLSLLMLKFEAAYGKLPTPTQRAEYELAHLGVIGTDAEPGLPTTDQDEPF